MEMTIVIIVLGLIQIGIGWYAEYKPRKEIENMSKLPPERNILLKVTPSIPYFKASFVAIPFFWFAYFVYDEKFINGVVSLIILGVVLAVFFSIVYWFMRASKNRLNNYCFDRCEKLEIKFIPGNLNSKPVVLCEPWSKRDSKRIFFARQT